MNTREQCVHVFRESDGTAYRSESRYDLGKTLALTSFPDVTIAVADVFA